MSDLGSAVATAESLDEDSQRNSHSHVNLGANLSESELQNTGDSETELKEKRLRSPNPNSPHPNYKLSNGQDIHVDVKSVDLVDGVDDDALRLRVQSSGEVSQSGVRLDHRIFPKPNGFCVLIVRHPKKAFGE
jgi:hypothetical protein